MKLRVAQSGPNTHASVTRAGQTETEQYCPLEEVMGQDTVSRQNVDKNSDVVSVRILPVFDSSVSKPSFDNETDGFPVDKTHCLLPDEVQLMDRFVEVLLGLMHQEVLDIFVTGSNSRFLSADTVTESRGRSQEIHMLPLTFSEYPSAFDGTKDEAWRDYVESGGFLQILSFKTRLPHATIMMDF